MDTKQTLIDVALKAFLERGYAAVPMKDIAAVVGIRQASIYYHFKDKHELLEACAHTFFLKWNEWMSAVLTPDLDLKTMLHGIIGSLGMDSNYIRQLYDAHTKSGQYRFILDVLTHCPEQLEQMHQFNTALYSMLEVKIDKAKQSGTIASHVSCRSVYIMLSALMEGSNILHFTDPEIDFKTEAQQLFQLLWEGITNAR